MNYVKINDAMIMVDIFFRQDLANKGEIESHISILCSTSNSLSLSLSLSLSASFVLENGNGRYSTMFLGACLLLVCFI